MAQVMEKKHDQISSDLMVAKMLPHVENKTWKGEDMER